MSNESRRLCKADGKGSSVMWAQAKEREEGSQGSGSPGRGLSACEGSEMEDRSERSRRTERPLVLEGGEQVECDLGWCGNCRSWLNGERPLTGLVLEFRFSCRWGNTWFRIVLEVLLVSVCLLYFHKKYTISNTSGRQMCGDFLHTQAILWYQPGIVRLGSNVVYLEVVSDPTG